MFFDVLGSGLATLFDGPLLLLLLVGALWGTVGGGLPGMTSTLTIGITLPFTFAMNPIEAVAFLLSVTVGTSFGNSLPAILVGLPGTPAAVLTALDGHALHKRGDSGLALAIAWISAMAGQAVSVLFFIAMVVPLGRLAYRFLSPELFALHLLGMVALVGLTGKNVAKGAAAAALGLMAAMIGPDPITNFPRFAFGVPGMRIGLEVLPLILGFLAVSELFRSFRQAHPWEAQAEEFSTRFPPLRRLKPIIRPTLMGTFIGTFLGAVPGVGSAAGAVVSYQQARIWSKHPEEFGHGSIEGIASNEAAQNASQSGEMVPTLGLGIPGSGSAVLVLSALTIQGLVPGPLLIQQSPELLHATVAGLLGATAILVLLGWWIAKGFLHVVLLDRSVVLSVALAMMIVGIYALRNSLFDVTVMLIAGVIGYFMLRYGYSTAAAAIAVVLGPGMESNLRRGLLLVQGDVGAFLTRPITGTVLAVAAAMLAYGVMSTMRDLKRQRAAEGIIAAPMNDD